MQFKDALSFPFKGPKPWPNLALIALAHLIPIIGPILVLGYGVIVEKLLVRDLQAAPPQFNFQNFSHYLQRGLMPFLVQLVVTFALMIVILPLMWGAMLAVVLLTVGSKNQPIIIPIAFASMFLLSIPLGNLVAVLCMPFSLRANLLGDFAAAFNFRWALDFLKRTGGRACWNIFLLQLIGIPLLLAGFLACYIGAYFAMAAFTFMMWHLQVQLYHLYLDRGGTPLTIQDELPEPAFPVIQGPAPPTHPNPLTD